MFAEEIVRIMFTDSVDGESVMTDYAIPEVLQNKPSLETVVQETLEANDCKCMDSEEDRFTLRHALVDTLRRYFPDIED